MKQSQGVILGNSPNAGDRSLPQGGQRFSDAEALSRFIKRSNTSLRQPGSFVMGAGIEPAKCRISRHHAHRPMCKGRSNNRMQTGGMRFSPKRHPSRMPRARSICVLRHPARTRERQGNKRKDVQASALTAEPCPATDSRTRTDDLWHYHRSISLPRHLPSRKFWCKGREALRNLFA